MIIRRGFARYATSLSFSAPSNGAFFFVTGHPWPASLVYELSIGMRQPSETPFAGGEGQDGRQ